MQDFNYNPENKTCMYGFVVIPSIGHSPPLNCSHIFLTHPNMSRANHVLVTIQTSP